MLMPQNYTPNMNLFTFSLSVGLYSFPTPPPCICNSIESYHLKKKNNCFEHMRKYNQVPHIICSTNVGNVTATKSHDLKIK